MCGARSHRILLCLLLAILLSACGGAAGPLTGLPSGQPAAGGDTSWVEVYFTRPEAEASRDYRGGPDEVLVTALDAARASIDLAVYNFNLWSVRDALLRAQQRGVVVRLVTESDNLDNPEVQELIEAGIPVVDDQREGLMHNKFVVIDRSQVWLGSMNLTAGAAYRDNNNLLLLRSVAIAEDYSTEFDEMFSEELFGPALRPATPNPVVEVNGVRVEVFFSPDDGVADRLAELIRSARESVHFLAYSFTSDELASALLEAAAAGLEVSGVMDAEQSLENQGGEYARFLQSGLDVRLDGSPGLMHHKVLIIDRSIVVTGSYNFTASAEQRNDENLVVLHSPAVALTFLAEFEQLYLQTSP